MKAKNEKKLILIGGNFINVDAIARAGINRDMSDLSITLVEGTQIFLYGEDAKEMIEELRKRSVDLNVGRQAGEPGIQNP